MIEEIDTFGNVGVKIADMKFTLYGLRKSDPIYETAESLQHQVTFPHIIKRGTWLEESYVEPKSPQQYSHVCAVPKDFSAVLAFGRIGHAGSDQTAQKVTSLVLQNEVAKLNR